MSRKAQRITCPAHLRHGLLSLLRWQFFVLMYFGHGAQQSPRLQAVELLDRQKKIECQLKARRSYEKQSRVAIYSVGAAFLDMRAGKG